MKKQEKKMIGILILVAVVIIAIIFFATRSKDKEVNNGGVAGQSSTSQGEYTKVEADGTIVNSSEKLNENKEMQGYSITNIKFEEKNGETIFSARVTNKTGSAQESFFGNIVLLDKKGNETGKIPVMISETQAGEAVDIEAIILDINYANAYDFKLEK